MFPLYIAWKHQKNQMFSGDFKKCRMGTMARNGLRDLYQPTVTGSKLTIETLEQGVKYVQSYQ